MNALHELSHVFGVGTSQRYRSRTKALAGILLLGCGLTSAQTILIDYDDGVTGNGLHDQSIANGGLEESSEAEGQSILHRSAAPGSAGEVPGYFYSHFDDNPSGGSSLAGPWMRDTGGRTEAHRTVISGWDGTGNDRPRRQLFLAPPNSVWSIADGDQFHLEFSAREGSGMDDSDWIKVFVYAVDYQNGNALTEIGDFHRVETPDDGSWTTGSIGISIDFSESYGDVSGQGIAFRFLIDRDSGGTALRSEFCLLDDFYLVAGNGIPVSPPLITDFSALDYYVAPGSGTTLNWATTGADQVTLSSSPGTVAASDSLSVNPATTTEYTLTASNLFGEVSRTLRVGVGPPRPNLVFFLVDDMGTQDTSVPFHFGPGGSPIQHGFFRTPHMESLADDGMRFTNAYAMPVCTPSRVCWITGKNSARHHVTNWTDPNGAESGYNTTPTHNSPTAWLRDGIAASETPLPTLLQAAGYRTIHCGKGHFGSSSHNRLPESLGFDLNIGGNQIGRPGEYTGDYGKGGSRAVPGLDDYHDTGTFLTEALTLELNQAIGEAVTDGAPFFAYMSHYAVHAPFNEDVRFSANYDGLGLGNSTRNFATLVEGMDKSLGDIRAHLGPLGVAKDTLIVFMGDNGSDSPYQAPDNSSPLRDKKGSKYEGGIRVPLLVAWAEPDPTNPFQAALDIAGDSIENDIVAIFDLFPTLLTVAGLESPADIDGHDLSNYLRGNPGEHRPQELLIHFPHDHTDDYYTILRQDDWKLIVNYGPDSYELYNLSTDVGETTDLSAGEPDRVMAMARRAAGMLDDAGAQWPTFEAGDADDPLGMPALPGVDLDADGISDNQEDINGNGLVDPGETDPDSNNSDGDPTLDGDEVRTGTDPLDATSFFKADISRDAFDHLILTWPSAPGATYRVETASEDASAWLPVASGISAEPDGSMTSFDFGLWPDDPIALFRIVLE